MNTPSKFSLSVLALGALLTTAHAQLDSPPAMVDYQGQLLNASGGPITGGGGPGTFGTATNYEIRFRIWKSQTSTAAPDLVWAEKQIVTVDASGFFSVRLGEGEAIPAPDGDPNPLVGTIPHAPTALLGAFDGNARFIGVTVMQPPAAPGEIQPRLKFLSSPFAILAEKARIAEFGPTNGVFSADQIGIGTTSPTTALHLRSSGSLNLLLEADTDNINEADQPSLTFSQDGGAQMTKLGYFGNLDHFGIETGGSRRLTVENTGDIGIGTSSPLEDLHVVRPDNDVARVYATGSNSGGGMFYAGQSQIWGGGFFYEGDGTPSMPGNFDRTVFFTRNFGTDSEVFSYAYNSTNVSFKGNIGVGTESPTDSITVAGNGDVRLNGGNFEPLGTQTDGIKWVNASGNYMAHIFRWGSNNRLMFTNNGTANTTGLYIASGAAFFTSTSDERLKSNIAPVTGILEKIKDIRVVGFNMDSMEIDTETGKASKRHLRPIRKTKAGKVIKHEIGSIAQDWMKEFPELVVEPENEDDYYGLAYDRIGIVAIGAAQELSKKVDEQQQQIAERDQKIADLEARLARIEKLMSAAK